MAEPKQQQQQQQQQHLAEENEVNSSKCCDISNDAIASQFTNVSSHQLGDRLFSLEDFHRRRNKVWHTTAPKKTKEYSLVVVTESTAAGSQNKKRRILLGKKHRGFGQGFYNSFGGKLHENETMVQCACRELQEETGIAIPEAYMAQSLVGAMHFTFQDESVEMIVRVYHVDISTSSSSSTASSTASNNPSSPLVNHPYPIDPNCIRGCDEITPEWFDNIYDIPLDNMFADDSLWLTRLLWAFYQHEQQRLNIDGYFHFHPGGQDVNAIQFYYMNIRSKRKTTSGGLLEKNTPAPAMTLEKRLFHALHSNQIHSPSIKEFKEAFAFCNAVKLHFKKQSFQVVIDVAGGHGALCGLLLITTSAQRGIVIDPANVGKQGVQKAWGAGFLQDKVLEYRHEDLRTGLPSCLTHILQTVPRDQVLVVACHACQHLSEEILEIVCTRFEGVHAAVMPCCQKDVTGGSWKAASQRLGIPIAQVMDLLLAGKVMSWNLPYEVRLKLIDASITPQNRVILCRAIGTTTLEQQQQQTSEQQKKLEAAHQKLAATYTRAHLNKKDNNKQSRYWTAGLQPSPYQMIGGGAGLLAVGFLTGFLVSNVANRKR